MCLSLFGVGVTYADDSDFKIENGVLKKYSGAGGVVVIPDSVTSIGEGAFNNCCQGTIDK
jgi:hypothetical protein